MEKHGLESNLPRKVRALFVSDLHLGCQFSTGHKIAQVFYAIEAEKIYLVGDCFDESRLKLRWSWTDKDALVIDQLAKSNSKGVQIFLTPGNHDTFLRSSSPVEALIEHGEMLRAFRPMLSFEIAEEFEYQSLNGCRLLITHGDLFDSVEKSLGGIPKLGSRIFDRVNWMIPRPIVLGLRKFFKMLFAKPKQIQSNLLEHVSNGEFDGVIFGHLHQPKLERIGDTIVANCGDWMGNESFLVETLSGEFQLFNFSEMVGTLDKGAPA